MRGDHPKRGDLTNAPKGTSKTQREAAEDAGMSRDQQVQAVRVNNVPLREVTPARVAEVAAWSIKRVHLRFGSAIESGGPFIAHVCDDFRAVNVIEQQALADVGFCRHSRARSCRCRRE
jgi:hypothetical protein